MSGWLVVLSLLACQEFNISTDDKPADDPVDTDEGVGIGQPDIEIEPAELRFGSLPVDCVSDELQVTVKNVGDAPLIVSEMKLVGVGADQFTLTPRNGDVAPRIPAGGQRILDVVFAPTFRATFDKAKVAVDSNDPDEPTVRSALLAEGADAAFREELFVQGPQRDVDVLFVIDNSESIVQERPRIINALTTFVGNFANLGLDYRLGLITTDMSDPTWGGVMLGPWISSSTSNPGQAINTQLNSARAEPNELANDEKGFDASNAALTTKINTGDNVGFLRADATLAVAVISDEDDASSTFGLFGGAVDYADWLQTMKPSAADVSFSAMVGPNNTKLIACNGGIFSQVQATGAQRYHTAIRRTGGTWSNICQLDFDPFVNHLAYVAAGLEYRFPLSDEPISISPTAITVEVGGQPVPFDATNGWTYNADEQSIELHGTAIPEPGEAVVITYPYDAENCLTDSGLP